MLGEGSDVAFGSGERDRLLEVCGGGIVAAGGVRRESLQDHDLDERAKATAAVRRVMEAAQQFGGVRLPSRPGRVRACATRSMARVTCSYSRR